MSSVFTKEQAFYATSDIGRSPERLNARHELFFRPIEREFQGARVLDLACHNGRWSFAALEAGAQHVTGIEFESQYVDAANQIFAGAYPTDRFEFQQGDMLDFLSQNRSEFDIVLCLGILYHTIHQVEILRHIRRINPRLLIVDSSVCAYRSAQQFYDAVEVASALEYVRATSANKAAFSITGGNKGKYWETIPSQRQLELWMEATGWRHKRLFQGPGTPAPSDYQAGLRVAYHCRPK